MRCIDPADGGQGSCRWGTKGESNPWIKLLMEFCMQIDPCNVGTPWNRVDARSYADCNRDSNPVVLCCLRANSAVPGTAFVLLDFGIGNVEHDAAEAGNPFETNQYSRQKYTSSNLHYG